MNRSAASFASLPIRSIIRRTETDGAAMVAVRAFTRRIPALPVGYAEARNIGLSQSGLGDSIVSMKTLCERSQFHFSESGAQKNLQFLRCRSSTSLRKK
jgi:hypothetical protein